jgi:hypothetical protein
VCVRVCVCVCVYVCEWIDAVKWGSVKKERLVLTWGYFEESSKMNWEIKLLCNNYFKNISIWFFKKKVANSLRETCKWNSSNRRSTKYHATMVLQTETQTKGRVIQEFEDRKNILY